MVSFSRVESKALFLPLALRAYDINLDQPAWDAIGYEPIAQIRVDRDALLSALAEEQDYLDEHDQHSPHSGDSLARFGEALEKDIKRSGDYFGWVALNKTSETVVITFRGTRGIDEWLKDVFIAPVPYPYAGGAFGLVHAGFLVMYKSVRRSALALVEAVPSARYRRLIICGHSLGAAVATISAPDVFESIGRHVVPEVRTFASPRPGDLLFAKTLVAQGMSVLTHRNRYDIVPTVPYPPYFHTDTIALIGGGKFLDPSFSHDLRKSYQPGLEDLVSDQSMFGGQPQYPYIYCEIP
jgi:predicted lipase